MINKMKPSYTHTHIHTQRCELEIVKYIVSSTPAGYRNDKSVL